MIPNTNPETGIAYGVISANKLDPELFLALWDKGENLHLKEVEERTKSQLEADADGLEDEVRIAMAEAGGFTEREYESVWDNWVEAEYNRQGYADREDFILTKLERGMQNIEIDEPVIEFDQDGVQGQIGWLGGAPIVWIFHSPVVGKYARCSPCVPGAGDLSNEGDHECWAPRKTSTRPPLVKLQRSESAWSRLR